MVHEATVTVANSAVSTYKYFNKQQNHNYPTPADKNSATNFTTQWISHTSHGAGMFHASINLQGEYYSRGDILRRRRPALASPRRRHNRAIPIRQKSWRTAKNRPTARRRQNRQTAQTNAGQITYRFTAQIRSCSKTQSADASEILEWPQGVKTGG